MNGADNDDVRGVVLAGTNPEDEVVGADVKVEEVLDGGYGV